MPEALSRCELLKCRPAHHYCPRLPTHTYRIISDLGIAAKRTHRGSRGGKSAKRARSLKKFVSLGLINARSVNKRAAEIHHFLHLTSIDVLAITETWFTIDHGSDDLWAFFPDGYSAVHVPRSGGKGGGVAILYRNTIRVDPPPSDLTISATTFEWLSLSLVVNSVSIRLIVVYRPPRSCIPIFLTEFSRLLDLLINMPGKLLVVGDFNLHVDLADDGPARRFRDLVDSYGLCQHVKEATHVHGHTIDLVLSRQSDNLVSDAFVSELIGDHFAVISVLRAHRPPLPRKVVSFRSLSSIDVDQLMADLKLIPMIAEPSSTMEGLIEQYNIGVAGVINSHAPTKTRSFAIRPENQWFSSDIAAMRRLCRKFECIWRRRGMAVDKEILLHHRRSLAGLISTAKSSFLRNKIAECGSDRRSLFSLLDRCLNGRKELTLPCHLSPGDLPTEFGHFFNRKIADIRADLDKLSSPTPPACEFTSPTTLSVFEPVNAAEIIELVLDCPSKSFFLDPIPTCLLKKVIHVLAKPIANLVNISLSSGEFPNSLK